MPKPNAKTMIQIVMRALKWGEIVGVIFTTVAIFFKVLNFPMASELLLIGLLTLGSVYFLLANAGPPQRKEEAKDGKKLDFADLLVFIVRKIMFIALSVLCVGYLFTILHLKGANEMMIIGLLSLALGLLISIILVLTKRERMAVLQSPIVRSVIALLFYFVTPLLQ